MIPKIIHYCWLSDDEFPESIKDCIASWNKHLPDYELRLWDRNRFDVNSQLWTKQAYEAKKYAFAADYIRLYALYHEGGIYLDSDVVVYKSFNDLLHLPYFIGEDRTHCFEPAIIGCEAGMPWIGRVLERYKDRQFIKLDGSYDMHGLPLVFHDRLVGKYQFQKTRGTAAYCGEDDVIRIFPHDYFNSRDYVGAIRTGNSYCSHNYLGSWLKKKNSVTDRMKPFVPRLVLNAFYACYYWMHGGDLAAKQIPYSK